LYSVSIGPPLKISGVIVGNISIASAGIPSYA